MSWIKNLSDLATNKQREDALKIVDAAYDAIDTEKAIRSHFNLNGDELKVNGFTYDLKDFENIYLVGFGKVACRAAQVIESILGDRLNAGAAIGIKKAVCEIVDTYEGTHPLPSKINFEATSHIKRVGEQATDKDLVIAIVGGGGSALLCGSQGECDQGQKLYKAFLDTGGDIKDLNLVRKHISELKGGGLAKILYPARVLGLIFSDVPGNDCSVIASGPTYKDETTIDDAKAIIEKYNLGDFELTETPKDDKYFEKVDNLLLVSNHNALNAMKDKAEELGYKAIEAGCDLYNFPKETFKILQDKSEENSVVIAAGETKLIIPEDCSGKGGRSDMLGLISIDDLKDNQIFVPFASDGKDNSDSAGVIVDSDVVDKIKNLGVDIERHKVCLDSYPIFEQVKSQIKTGPIESNVSDLMILLNYKK